MDSNAKAPKLLSVVEVASRLSCSRNHVYGLIAGSQLRSVDLRGSGTKSKIRVREDDLIAFIDARTTGDSRPTAVVDSWGSVPRR